MNVSAGKVDHWYSDMSINLSKHIRLYACRHRGRELYQQHQKLPTPLRPSLWFTALPCARAVSGQVYLPNGNNTITARGRSLRRYNAKYASRTASR